MIPLPNPNQLRNVKIAANIGGTLINAASTYLVNNPDVVAQITSNPDLLVGGAILASSILLTVPLHTIFTPGPLFREASEANQPQTEIDLSLAIATTSQLISEGILISNLI